MRGCGHKYSSPSKNLSVPSVAANRRHFANSRPNRWARFARPPGNSRRRLLTHRDETPSNNATEEGKSTWTGQCIPKRAHSTNRVCESTTQFVPSMIGVFPAKSKGSLLRKLAVQSITLALLFYLSLVSYDIPV